MEDVAKTVDSPCDDQEDLIDLYTDIEVDPQISNPPSGPPPPPPRFDMTDSSAPLPPLPQRQLRPTPARHRPRPSSAPQRTSPPPVPPRVGVLPPIPARSAPNRRRTGGVISVPPSRPSMTAPPPLVPQRLLPSTPASHRLLPPPVPSRTRAPLVPSRAGASPPIPARSAVRLRRTVGVISVPQPPVANQSVQMETSGAMEDMPKTVASPYTEQDLINFDEEDPQISNMPSGPPPPPPCFDMTDNEEISAYSSVPTIGLPPPLPQRQLPPTTARHQQPPPPVPERTTPPPVPPRPGVPPPIPARSAPSPRR